MNKLLLAALIAAVPLVAAPAAAEPNLATKGMMLPEPVRFEFVFEAAKGACPVMERYAMNADQTLEFVSALVKKLQLSDNETTLLLNYCIMYGRGINAA